MTEITLSKDYGYEQYMAKGLATGTIINASGATFIQDNNNSDDGRSNPYPVAVKQTSHVVLEGGTILGNVDQTTDRLTVYHFDPGNSAGIRLEDSTDAVIRDWRIDKAWDGIRVSWNTDNFLIEDTWITNARDDAIENDKLNSGTIRNSLFDGVMGGISLDPSSSSPVDGSGESVTIDHVLIRMQEYLAGGEVTHGSPLKLDKSLPMPDLHIVNSVFAIEDVHHNGTERLAVAWDNLVESSGNVFLNLSDEPLPSSYPMPPKGWTVLQGQEARDYWQQARDAWVDEHSGSGTAPVDPPSLPGDTSIDPTPLPDDTSTDPTPLPDNTSTDPTPLPDNTPTDPTPLPDNTSTDPTPLPDDTSNDPTPIQQPLGDATFEGANLKGSKAGETIIGNSLDNYIDGRDGDDIIVGGAGDDVIRSNDGADQLWGGEGNDIFLYTHSSDSRDRAGIDTIQDFTRGQDKIDLSELDANRGASGDQAFVITNGAPGAGELSIHFDANTGNTVINANVDHEAAPELTIVLAGEHHLTASDFIL